jgi:D-sedoheptulose 7-phosphate isomerase
MKNKTKQIVVDLIIQFPNLESIKSNLIKAIDMIINCYESGNKILVCGNGGSAADSLHIVGELMKSFVLNRNLDERDKKKFYANCSDADYITTNLEKALPAISLVNEIAFSSAFSNDKTSDLVFAQQIYGLGNKGDILLALSTSGNSTNIKYACEVAKSLGLYSIGLTGISGGVLANIVDILINAPELETYKIQELHLPIYHTICMAVESEIFS